MASAPYCKGLPGTSRRGSYTIAARKSNPAAAKRLIQNGTPTRHLVSLALPPLTLTSIGLAQAASNATNSSAGHTA